MKKLKPWGIIEIISDRLAGKSAYRIGKRHGISARWVRHLAASFVETGKVPQIMPCGRKKKPISEDEIEKVRDAYEIYHSCAVRLEDCLDEFMDIHMPHNRIHQIMRSLKLAKRHRKKSQRRKWVRFERYKSNSLWHIDWSLLGRKWFIVIEDDASRFIVGYGLFDIANMDNSIAVMERAIAAYGAPKALLSGHDSQFIGVVQKNVKKEPSQFQQFLIKHKIKHILGRINHPQTNGKLERAFGTIKSKIKEFSSLDELIHWYNGIRPHMSLKDGLETPAQAYVRKMKSKKKIAVQMVVR